MTFKTNLRTLKAGEKKTDQSGNLGPQEKHKGELPRFSFCLLGLWLGTEENATWKPNVMNKNKHWQKRDVSQAKDQERHSLERKV